MCIREDQLQTARDVRTSESEEDQARILAYYLWELRGCPIGSPEEDWSLAEQLLSLAKAEESVKFSLSREIVFRYNQGSSQEGVARSLGVTRWRVRKALGLTGRPSSYASL